jgi:hypothetical protein
MAIGDRVRVSYGTIGVHDENVPVYDLQRDATGSVMFDVKKSASPKVVGAVKGGSTGMIVDVPVQVLKALLKQGSEGAASLGAEYVFVFPVKFDRYGTAWVPQDHVHVVG